MAVHSGRFGVVNAQATVRNWSLQETMNAPQHVASNTRFGRARRKGPREWSGSFQQWGHSPTVMPGESFSFQGYIAPDNDIVAGVGGVLSGTAFVNQVAITWNWQSNEAVSYQTDFQGHLALTRATGAAALTDAATPVLDIPSLGKIQYSTDGTAFTDFTNVTQAVLTISNQIQSYVNSSTVIATNLWTGRVAGTLDWTLAITHENSEPVLAMGPDYWIRLYVNATQFWLLKWGIMREVGGLQVDRESGKVIQLTESIEMQGFSQVDGAIGNITKPGNVVWWGT